MPKTYSPKISPVPEICQWINVPLHDIRHCLEQNAWRLARNAEGAFHCADDSLPHELDSTWTGEKASWRCQAIPRIHLMLEGEHTLTFVRHEQATTVQLQAGDIWFFPADAHDNETFSTSCRYMAVIFHAGFTRFIIVNHATLEAAREKRHLHRSVVRHTWMLHWQEVRPPALIAALDALTLAIRRDAPGGAASSVELAGHHLARALLLLIHDWVRHTKGGESPLGKAHASWQGIDRYLQENYHRPLNRKMAARVLGLHPNRISALCAQFAGKSFQKILEERRLRQAMRFLEDTDHKIETISALCGYVSAAYFSRTFRRITGVTPGMWRLKPVKDKP